MKKKERKKEASKKGNEVRKEVKKIIDSKPKKKKGLLRKKEVKQHLFAIYKLDAKKAEGWKLVSEQGDLILMEKEV